MSGLKIWKNEDDETCRFGGVRLFCCLSRLFAPFNLAQITPNLLPIPSSLDFPFSNFVPTQIMGLDYLFVTHRPFFCSLERC
jgi:hypothetical protein